VGLRLGLPERKATKALRIAGKEGTEPGEDAAEVVTDGGEDSVGGIAGPALEIAAAEMGPRASYIW